MEILIDVLKKYLADNFALYVKVLGFHWNVTGNNFLQLHSFFKTIYEDLDITNDNIAEHIRALNSFAPGSISRILELAEIKCEKNILADSEMISKLYSDNEIIMKTINLAVKLATKFDKQGLLNFLTARMETHEKLQWMLGSLK